MEYLRNANSPFLVFRGQSPDSPWYIVPADDKANAWLIISQIILNTLEELKLDYPKLSKAHRKELLAIRKLLEK